MTGLVLARVVDDGSRNPGLWPLLIIVLLGVATVLLIKNMSGRIKRLPPEFDQREQVTPPDGPASSA